MIIWLYTLCYNEEQMIPYFLRYYEQFVQKIIVYDNDSTDKSVEMLKDHAEIRRLDTGGLYIGKAHDDIRNSAWKEARGKSVDWVIICDMDEFLYHKRGLDNCLFECKQKGFNLPLSEGVTMIHKHFPVTSGQIMEEVQFGRFNKVIDKEIIFNPDDILEINYSPGRHSCNPSGTIARGGYCGLKMLHMRSLGIDYMLERNKTRSSRYAAINNNQCGVHCFISEEKTVDNFNKRWISKIKIV